MRVFTTTRCHPPLMTNRHSTALIRPVDPEDIPQIVDLYRRVFGDRRIASPESLAAFFQKTLFGGPWHDEQVPSLAAVDKQGCIEGFLGVFLRTMKFQDQTIRVAICNNYMVTPSSRSSLCAIQLLKALFSGPQDLSMAEGSNSSRKIWEALGGKTALLYSLDWARPLRPLRYVNSLISTQGVLSKLWWLTTPTCQIADSFLGLLARDYLGRKPAGVTCEELELDMLLNELPDFTHGSSLRPEYSRESLTWLMNVFSAKRGYGNLRKRVLRDSHGRISGWFIYYAKRNGAGKVLQVVARPDTIADVLQGLFHDAYCQGAIALTGGVDPKFTREFSEARCVLAQRNSWILVHAKDEEITAAFDQGDAFFTRMEGEWLFYNAMNPDPN